MCKNYGKVAFVILFLQIKTVVVMQGMAKMGMTAISAVRFPTKGIFFICGNKMKNI
jgi:hypothetical protein